MCTYFILLNLTFFLYPILGAKLIPDFQKCKANDLSTNDCLKFAIQSALATLKNGVPNLNVPPFQPITLPRVTTHEYLGLVNIEQRYKDFVISGLADAEIRKVESTISPSTWKITLQVFRPECSFRANYTFDGRLFEYPIAGSGWCTITLKNISETVEVSAEISEKNHESYVSVKNVAVGLRPERVVYFFANLFNGNELLEGEMNNLINSNWRPLFERVRPSYEDMLGIVYRDYANKIFEKVAVKNIFLD